MFLSFRFAIACVAFAATGSILYNATAAEVAANQEQQKTPTIPETLVEADLPETGEPSNFDSDSLESYDPVLDGWRFGSPAVEGYRADSSTAATLFDMPDIDVPATVNVIPEQLLRDQQVLRFYDAIRDAGGVTPAGDSFYSDRVFLRGMELGSRDFRKDGFLDPTFVPRDFQNVERIEILKGPSSTLYGASSPAGMINLVTKKPLEDTFSDFGFQFGSFNLQRYTLDTNGYVSSSGDVLYRLNIAHEDTDSFRDFGFISRTLIAPGVTWNLDDRTRLTWLAEWHKDHRRGDQGMPAINGDPLALPPSRYVGEPANDFIHFQEFRQSLMLARDLSDDWTFEIGGSSLFYEFPASVTAASNPPLPTPFFFRTRTDIPREDEQSQSMITNLAGEFDTGQLHHKAVVGMEYVYFDSDSVYNFGLVGPLDVENPVYTNPPAFPVGSTAFPVYRQNRLGAYLQDIVDVTPHWSVIGGVRFDTVDFKFDRTLNFGVPMTFDTQQTFDRVSPRAGIVYKPLEEDVLSVYFNYSQSFAPPGGGIYINPGNLKPILGEGYELGVKTQLLPWLSLNTAGFYATRKNADLNTSSFFLIQVGEERAQGVEINLVGELTERWSTVANYTYTDTRLFDAVDPILNGNHQRNVPFNTANFWSRYNFVQNQLHTIGAALGLVYLGERPGDLANTFDLPAFSRWDAGLYYTRGRLNASLYAENLFDVAYAANSIDQFQVFPGAPANLRAQVGYTY